MKLKIINENINIKKDCGNVEYNASVFNKGANSCGNVIAVCEKDTPRDNFNRAVSHVYKYMYNLGPVAGVVETIKKYNLKKDDVLGLISMLRSENGLKDYEAEEILEQTDFTAAEEIHEIEKEENSSIVNEKDYGGAFDIRKDQYFTRDDVNSAGEAAVEKLNADLPNNLEVIGCWLENNELKITIQDLDNQAEYEQSVKIDMRTIRTPDDLVNKYVPKLVELFKQIIK